ncbi:putative retrotransposon gag domain-containing protein [Helianthus annuus]|nr:putative retrotransposon gag domain-containing protein [Helianthus annuus]
METRKRTNSEFQAETDQKFAAHDAMFERILTEMQSLNVSIQAMRNQTPNGLPRSSSGSGGGLVTNSNPKPYLKLLFPRFRGDDLAGWLYQAEKYFEFQHVEDGDKEHLASFHLDGIALQWHRWLTKSKGPMTWVEFSRALQARFGPTDYEDPAEALSRLKQTTTVVAYQEEFERLSHRVDNLPEPFLIGCFVGGLKDEVRLEVKLKTPRSLPDAIGLARLVEEKLHISDGIGSTVTNTTSSSAAGFLGPQPTQQLTVPVPASNQVRRLTSAELRDRHAKGLCYYCDETYKPGHRCSKPQLMMITDPTDNPDLHLEAKVNSSGVE